MAGDVGAAGGANGFQNAGAAGPGAANPQDSQASMKQMQDTFNKAVAENAEMTQIQTEGNSRKRAASAAPQ